MNLLRRIWAPVLSGRTYGELAYLLAGLFFGILWFVLTVTLWTLGVGLAIIWVGVAIFVGTQALMRPLGVFERAQVRVLLGKDIPKPAPLSRHDEHENPPFFDRTLRWSREVIHDVHSWRVAAWVMLRVILGPVGFSVALTAFVVGVTLLIVPPVALFVVPMCAWIIRWMADLHRWFAEKLLGPFGDEVRQVALARASRAEEQVRIDQELHDSIGHMVSMIVVQAGAGAHVFEKDPAFAKKALKNIEERGRAALGELDRIIARIRGDKPESLTPLPGVDDLPGLIDGAREAGVSLTSRLELEDVSPSLGRGIYRVIQEALTNAAKHAPGGEVEVAAVSSADLVVLSVTNTMVEDGGASGSGSRARRADGAGEGNGLASIRDRVILLGGHATIGTTPDGRFAVKAVLPKDGMLPDEGRVDCSLTGRCRCVVCRTVRRSGK